MAYDPGAIDATLAAAVGDDAGLIAELRIAFHDAAERAYAALSDAKDAPAWREAAWRLKGLAASFGAVRLVALAGEAAACAPGEAEMLRRIRRMIDRLA